MVPSFPMLAVIAPFLLTLTVNGAEGAAAPPPPPPPPPAPPTSLGGLGGGTSSGTGAGAGGGGAPGGDVIVMSSVLVCPWLRKSLAVQVRVFVPAVEELKLVVQLLLPVQSVPAVGSVRVTDCISKLSLAEQVTLAVSPVSRLVLSELRLTLGAVVSTVIVLFVEAKPVFELASVALQVQR